MKLAKQVMGTLRRRGRLCLPTATTTRPVFASIIDAKIEGREIVTPEVEAPPKVVNLMEALRKSLDTVSAAKKAPVSPFSEESRPAKKRAPEFRCEMTSNQRLWDGFGRKSGKRDTRVLGFLDTFVQAER